MRSTNILIPTLLTALLAPGLAAAETLNVQVVWSNSGNPIAGAQVFAGETGTSDVLITDSEGRVSLDVASLSRYTVTAALSETDKIFKKPVFTTTATTVLGASGADLRIGLGPYQFSDTLSAPSVTTELFNGVVTGLDTSLPGGWVVKSPTSSTSAASAGTPDASFTVYSPVGDAPFLFAAQYAAGEDGTWSEYDVPVSYGLVFDAAPASAVPLTSTFSGATNLALAGTAADSSTCAYVDIEMPDARGFLSLTSVCSDTSADGASYEFATPAMTGALASARFAYSASTLSATGGQFASASGFAGAGTLELAPQPVPEGYTPALLADLPGTSFDVLGDDDAEREIFVFNETHTGPVGIVLSNTLWTVLNLDTSAPISIPRVPRDADLPAIGARLPGIGNQTSVLITEFSSQDPHNFSMSYANLETYLPAPDEGVRALSPLGNR